jgi:hypothetical protein
MYETPLSRFQELRVLDLAGFDDFLQNKDLMGIGDLYFLKCLVLGSKWIAEIPKEIGNLLFLQTLDLRATSVTELPASVLLARQLKRLYVNSRTKIPDGIGKLEDLEEIGDMNVSKTELLEELRSLTKLILLRIAIWSWDYSYGDSVLEALVRLLAEGRIQTLSILTCCSLRFLYRLDAGLAPPSLQKLEISHNALVALPRWIFSLENLSFLSVEVHKLSQEIIDMLGQLQNLLVLSLTSKHAPEHNSRFGNRADGFRKLTGFHFASNAMGKVFGPARTLLNLKRLKLSFHVSRTKDISPGFDFGLENLRSVEHVNVGIICFHASRRVVEEAESAIQRAIYTCRGCRPNLRMQRLREQDMVDTSKEEVGDVVYCNVPSSHE